MSNNLLTSQYAAPNLPVDWSTLDAIPPLLADAGCVAAAVLDLTRPESTAMLEMSGMSPPSSSGVWTIGPNGSLTVTLAHPCSSHYLLVMAAQPFLWPAVHTEQRLLLSINGQPIGDWRFQNQASFPRKRVFKIDKALIGDASSFTLSLDIPTRRAPFDLGINQDKRELGVQLSQLSLYQIERMPPADWLFWELGREVGPEASKTFDQKVESGFWSRYVGGYRILDIGFRGAPDGDVKPILPHAIGVDLDYPGYDGRTLPFADGSQDLVYSSHSLEHIPGYVNAIQDWYRVLRVGGHIIVSVPHSHLYERGRRPPSLWNMDHQRFFTPSSLLAEFEAALAPNSYRIRYLADNDFGYDYLSDPNQHPNGCYEISVVVQKIAPPSWSLRN